MIKKFYMPTRVIAGADCILQNSDIFKTLGTKALLVTGRHSAKLNGSEKDVTSALETAGIDYVIFNKVMSNPTISCVYEGAEFAKANGVDFIIAIGGGSPMDAGKAIALLAAQEVDEENLFTGSYQNKVLPMAFVPTTAGTGSEVTQYSILTNDKAQTKTSIASDLLFPAVAFLDARYTEHLSITTTINTAIDALSHAVEGMLCLKASPASDALAVASIRMITECVPDILHVLTQDPEGSLSLAKREQLLQASFLAGVVIAQTGTTAVHAMGYSLTYFKDIDHGRANGLLLAEYLNLVAKERPEVVRRILEPMGLSAVNSFKEMLNELLGQKETISTEEIAQYSRLASQTRNMANCIVKASEADLREIYRASFEE